MEPLGPSLRRARRREHPLVRVAVALLLSLGLNLALGLLVDSTFLGILPRSDLRPVGLAPLSASAWEANRAIATARDASPPVPVPPPPKPPKEHGQIVDLGPAGPDDKEVEPPTDANYLAERSTRVEKETRARNPGRLERAPPAPAAVKPGGQEGEADRSIPGRVGTKGEGSKPQRLASAAPPAAPAPSLSQQPGDAGGDLLRLREPTLAPSPAPGSGGEGGARLRGQFDPRLATSPETLARLSGGPPTELLGDLEEGTGTFLNARQWKYATYFTGTITRAVDGAWKPEQAYLLRDPDATVFPERKWTTYVDVVLDDRGYLKSTRVVRPSGLDFLDRVAVDALREGSPFLNPPSGLVENGEIRYIHVFSLDMRGFREALRQVRHR
jgi:outer membrane biosynthesis protein TonB